MSHPRVTVAIPVLDEEEHIAACLTAVTHQTYPGPIEILVVDGGSRDRTRVLVESFPDVRVLHNERRLQSAGLNLALREATGDVFVRVDARSVVDPDYVSRCVEALDRTGAAMVGGALVPAVCPGDVDLRIGVAVAMRSRLGIGTGRFHRSDGSAGWVDTVYLGAFPTALLRAVGGYDGTRATNEDAELAWRMRRHGGVWFDPAIRSSYRPRATVGEVARQFFRYGRGRARTVVSHPTSLAPRQLAAPALILGLVSPWRRAVGGAYVMTLGGVLAMARHHPWRVARWVPGVVAVMHMAWGIGFLSALPTAVLERREAR